MQILNKKTFCTVLVIKNKKDDADWINNFINNFNCLIIFFFVICKHLFFDQW